MELSITTHAKRIIRVMKNKINSAREIIKWAQLINFMANLRGGRLIKSMKNKKGRFGSSPWFTYICSTPFSTFQTLFTSLRAYIRNTLNVVAPLLQKCSII